MPWWPRIERLKRVESGWPKSGASAARPALRVAQLEREHTALEAAGRLVSGDVIDLAQTRAIRLRRQRKRVIEAF